MEGTSLNSFIVTTVKFFDMMGMEPFKESRSSSKANYVQIFVFWFSALNLNISIILEIVYLYKALGSFSSFLEATALAPCIGFCIIAELKIMIVSRRKKEILEYFSTLNQMFPKSRAGQELYKVKSYSDIILRVGRFYSVLTMLTIWSFNIFPLIVSFYELYNGQPFVMRYSYYLWYPYEITSYVGYVFTLVHQFLAGHYCACGTIAVDLLLFSMIYLLCMNLEYIAVNLEAVAAKEGNEFEAVEKLEAIMYQHKQILRLSEVTKDVFSLIILFNFILSSIIICLVGFHATAGIRILDLIKYLLFMLLEMFQIFGICYFGDNLITSSQKISDAAFNSDWLQGSKRYRKTILVIIHRAQKPAVMTALGFSIVSLRSFSKVMSTSYQFFALLRKVYKK